MTMPLRCAAICTRKEYTYKASFTILVIVSFTILESTKFRQILRKFELIAIQGHPRSSILMPIESAYATSY